MNHTYKNLPERNLYKPLAVTMLQWNAVHDAGRKNDRCAGNGRESEWRKNAQGDV